MAIVLVALVAGACGGDSDEGVATNKAEWEEQHGDAVSLVSDDIDRSVQALNAGQRPVLLSECTQLRDDLAEAREAVPVPDPTVDAALRSALEATTTAAESCVEGARVAGEAHLVEEAQRQMAVARERFDEAQTALAAWQ